MTTLPLPLCAALVAGPVATGLLVRRVRDHHRARLLAGAAAAGFLAVALALAALLRLAGARGLVVDPWALPGWGGGRPALGVDALSAPVLALLALITAITILAWPRRMTRPRTLAALLVAEGLVAGMLTALDLGLIVLFWIAASGLALVEIRRGRRTGPRRTLAHTWAALLLAAALCLLAAAVVVQVSGIRAGVDAPLHIPALLARGAGDTTGLVALALIGVAVVLRGAVVPVHGWVPLAFEHGPPGAVLLFWAAQPGAYMFARVLAPLSPGGDPARVLLAVLGLVTAVYAALLALAQTDLRRLVGFLATSHGGILLIGLATTNAEGIAGGTMLWLSASTAVTGLALITIALETRTGTTDMRRLGGLSRTLPRLAVCFLIFGLAAVGMPGMLGFVAEDMLFHGVLASYPLVAAVLLVATVLNGITVMRAYTRVFLGEPPPTGVVVPRGRELRPRERLAAAILAGLLLVLGLRPGALVSFQAGAADALAEPPAQVAPSHRGP